MQYSANLHLNLPEDTDPLEVSKLSENFEALDGAVAEAAAASAKEAFSVGDTLTTLRTDLGDNWLLCNGELFTSEQYPKLAEVSPDFTTNLANDLYVKYTCAASAEHPAINGAGYSVVVDKYFVTASFGTATGNSKNYIWVFVQDILSGQQFVFSIPTKTGGAFANTKYSVHYVNDNFVVQFTGASSGNTYIGLAMCSGNPLVRDNWVVYYSDSTHSAVQFTAAIYQDGTYYFMYSTKRYQIVSFSPFTLVEYTLPNTPHSRSGDTVAFNNKIYVMSYNSPMANYTYTLHTYINELSADFSAWTESEISITPEMAGSDHAYNSPNISVNRMVSSDSVLVIDFTQTISANNANYTSRSRAVHIELSSIENYAVSYLPMDTNRGTPIKCRDMYAVSLNSLIVFYRTIEDWVSDTRYVAVTTPTGFPTSNAKYLSKYNSNHNVYIMPWYSAGTPAVGLLNYIVPILTASTAFVYIKAKEDSTNVNQQTDTPAP